MKYLLKLALIGATACAFSGSALATENDFSFDDVKFAVSGGLVSAPAELSGSGYKDKVGVGIGGAVSYQDTVLAADYIDAGVNDRVDFNLGRSFSIYDGVSVVAHVGYMDFLEDESDTEFNYAFSFGGGVNYIASDSLEFGFGVEHLELETVSDGKIGVDGMYSSVSLRATKNMVVSLSHRSALDEITLGATYYF
jgi:hypothetical protein